MLQDGLAGPHAVFGETHSCCISQNVYLRHRLAVSAHASRLLSLSLQAGPHSKSICLGLMILRRYRGSALRCEALRLPPFAVTVVVGNIPGRKSSALGSARCHQRGLLSPALGAQAGSHQGNATL